MTTQPNFLTIVTLKLNFTPFELERHSEAAKAFGLDLETYLFQVVSNFLRQNK